MRNWVSHGIRRIYVILSKTIKFYFLERPSPTAVPGYHGRRRVRYRGQGEGLQIIEHEIEWIERFRKTDTYRFVPRLLEISVEFGNAFYDIQYYPYPSFEQVIRSNMNASFFVRKRWNILFKGLAETLYNTQNSLEVPEDYLDEMVFEVLDARLADMPKDPALQQILSADRMRIQGSDQIGLRRILDRLRAHEEFRKRMVPAQLHAVHGRMSLENILCGMRAKRMILLHGGGCAKGIYGDIAKDVARLYHELRGRLLHLRERQYSLIVTLVDGVPELDFEILNSALRDRLVDNYVMVRDAVESWIQPQHGNILYRAAFYEACEPLHDVFRKDMRRSEQLMLLATAILRLNQWLQKYHADIYAQLEVE